jgi:hypothetical protein
MIVSFKVVFNLVLSNSKTHLIVKLETFPCLRRARAGFGWGQGAVFPRPNSGKLERGVLNYGANNRCILGMRESGLGVLGESTEEVTWRDHRDDAT